MKPLNQSGQTLLVAVLIFIILLISLPSIIFFNRMAGRSGTSQIKNQKALSVAQEGLAYAIRTLSKDEPTWTQALTGVGGDFPAEFTTGIEPTKYRGSAGGIYTIECFRGAPLESYQIRVLIKGSAGSSDAKNTHDDRAIEAILSKKTVAVTLTNQVQTAVAFQFAKPIFLSPPVVGPPAVAPSIIDIHWGPMALFDSTAPPSLPPTWDLGYVGPPYPNTAIDFQRFPRKFSTGPMRGINISPYLFPRTSQAETDHLEYWSNAALGFPNVIAESAYTTSAKSIPASPILQPSCSPGKTCDAAPPLSTYFEVKPQTVPPTGVARFSDYGAGVANDRTFYVDGNAEFNNLDLDLQNGAFIVTGNLELLIAGGGSDMNLRIPPTTRLEYPYTPMNVFFPCRASLPATGGGACPVSTAVGPGVGAQFRGFLYVKGDLIVSSAGWTMSGVIRVDGDVKIAPGAALTLFYDDQINRNILVDPIELLIDSQRVVNVS